MRFVITLEILMTKKAWFEKKKQLSTVKETFLGLFSSN